MLDKLILILFVLELILADEYRTVTTLNGDVRGKLEVTLFHRRPFHSFRGIPYAQPPLGELRFKPPVPVHNWTGIRDGLEFGGECTQGTESYYFAGTEDCLYLNVFVPDTTSNERLPVMFFIHGGAYIAGSSNELFPDFLIPHNVILVTINYRLGPLGFMSLGTPEYSGNMGLKDQSLALKWVNDNIEFFGGDRANITIFGVSAGSASVHFQTMSPMSRGLFKRAILQSGAALNLWAEYLPNNHSSVLMEFGKNFGNVSDNNIEELIDYLKHVDNKLLQLQLTKPFYTPGRERISNENIWTPLVESKNALDPFLIESPDDILERPLQSDIDTLMGFCSAEMYSIVTEELLNPDLLKPFNRTFELQLPKLRQRYDYDSEEYREISHEIRKFYFPSSPDVGAETLYEYNQLLSDIWFIYGIVNAAKLQKTHSSGNTYLYKFSVESDLNLVKQFLGIDLREHNLNGSSHGDDMLYLFRFTPAYAPPIDYERFAEDSVEIQTIKLITELWTNFAKFGTPTLPTDLVQFKSIDDDTLNYGDITNDGLVLGVNPSDHIVKFWDHIYVKFKDIFHN